MPKRHLTTVQQLAATRAREAFMHYRDARLLAEERIRAQVADELAGKKYELDKMIWRAVREDGVPVLPLHRDYLGTSDNKMVYEALRRIDAESGTAREVGAAKTVERYALTDAEPTNVHLLGYPVIKITMQGDDWDTFIAEARAGKRLRNPQYADSDEAVVYWMGGEGFGHEYDHAGSAGYMIDHPVLTFHRERWAEVADAARALGVSDPGVPVAPVRRSIGEAVA